MNTELKRLNSTNIEEATKLYIDVFNGEPWYDGWELEDARERLEDIFNNPNFIGNGIYDDKEELIGFLLGYTEKWLSSNNFYLNEMCVKTDLQSKGIGSKLLKEFENICEEKKISRIYLLTAREGQAEAFYKKSNFYVSPKMIMMSKRLDFS